MYVIDNHQLPRAALPGIEHQTLANADNGLTRLSVWRQSMAPGAATPPHSHDCDEVVLCLSGSGEVHSEGRVQRFGADSTVVLAQGRDHQLFNVGPEPLEIVGLFGATPVLTRLPDGSAIELPWRT